VKLNLSIIITVYNNSDYLSRCLTNILKQSILPDEIIIIDDGSKEKINLNQIKKHKTKFKKIYLYRQKHSGPSAARNFGLKKSKCNLITFFDVDDEMLKDFIKKKMNILKKINLDSIIGIHSFFFKENKKIHFTEDRVKLKKIDLIGYYFYGISTILNNYILIKKNVLKLKGFDRNLMINEDFDFFIRAIKNNFKIITLNSYDVRVNLTKNSLTRNKKINFVYSEQKKFLLKAKRLKYFTKNEQLKRERYLEFSTLKNLIIQNQSFLKITMQMLKYFKIAILKF